MVKKRVYEGVFIAAVQEARMADQFYKRSLLSKVFRTLYSSNHLQKETLNKFCKTIDKISQKIAFSKLVTFPLVLSSVISIFKTQQLKNCFKKWIQWQKIEKLQTKILWNKIDDVFVEWKRLTAFRSGLSIHTTQLKTKVFSALERHKRRQKVKKYRNL